MPTPAQLAAQAATPDPNVAAQQVRPGQPGPHPAVAAAPAPPGAGFPPGLAPPDPRVGASGLPPHLADPGRFVQPHGEPGGNAHLAQEPTEDELHLAESHKLKCPKCDHVQTAKNSKCGHCGHDLQEARKAKFANMSVEEGNAVAIALGLPDFIKVKKSDEPDKDKAEQGKKKVCPACKAENQADAIKCKRCGKALPGIKARDKEDTKKGREELKTGQPHQAVIYNTQGLNLAIEEDGLLWKVACKTGTLALSPGPGQTDAEVPLELSDDLFNDMLLSFQEKAFPYVTVPETHANGSLENTGYVRKAEVLTKDQLLADQRLPEKHRGIIEADPSETRYLLAGIDFTEPDVREKAARGSIPDTSIGVKFNFRNKRTGKLYRAAWEHLALTPIPWVDGLVPFGLSQQDHQVFDAEELALPYDGVYVPTQLFMAIEFDPAKHRRDVKGRFAKMLGGLKQGQSVRLPDGVMVTRGPDNVAGKLKVHKPNGEVIGEHDNPERAANRALDNSSSTDVPSDLNETSSPNASPAVPGRIDATLRRIEDEGITPPDAVDVLYRENLSNADLEDLADSDSDYATSAEAALERRRGDGTIQGTPGVNDEVWSGLDPEPIDSLSDQEAAELLDAFGDAEMERELTDREKSYRDALIAAKPDIAAEGAGRPAGEGGPVMDPPAVGPKLKGHQIPNPKTAPESVAWIVHSRLNKMKTIGDVQHFKTHDGKQIKVELLGPTDKEKKKGVNTGNFKLTMPDGTEYTEKIPANVSARIRAAGSDHNLSQDAPGPGTEDLPNDDQDASLFAALPATHRETGDLSEMPTKTVEQLLASQQAELEASQKRIQQLESSLELAQGTISSQGEQLHTDAVTKRIEQLQATGYSPDLCKRVKAVMLGDKSRITGGETGINLSIQHEKPAKDGEAAGLEEIKLSSPTEIAEFLLAGIPVDSGAASMVASVQSGVSQLAASAHEDANSEEARKAAVEANERKRHPERFDADGKRK